METSCGGLDKNGIKKLWDSMTQPEEPIKGIPLDNNLVLVLTRSGQRIRKVVGNYVHRHTEEATDLDEQDTEYDEEKDVFYIKEGWFEQCLYGYGAFASWHINDEVIGYLPLPAVKLPERKG